MENKKMDKKAIKERVLTHIKSGKNYSQTKEMLEKEGIDYPALKTSFYKWRESIFPSQKRDVALEISGEKRRDREEKSKKTKKVMDWTPAKQKKADESKLGELINRGLFSVIPCPSGELRFEDVQQVNLGGAIIGTVQFYFPDFQLDHPIVILVVRGVILVIKVKALCYAIKKKVKEVKESVIGGGDAIKPEWKEKERGALSTHGVSTHGNRGRRRI